MKTSRTTGEAQWQHYSVLHKRDQKQSALTGLSANTEHTQHYISILYTLTQNIGNHCVVTHQYDGTKWTPQALV